MTKSLKIDEVKPNEATRTEGGEIMRALIDMWMHEGIQKGMQQGIYQGLITNATDMALPAIEAKFDYVPEATRSRLKRFLVISG